MTSHSKLLSPESSPDGVAKSIGVRRVNNLPLYIFGAIMLIFMLLMGIVAMNRATERGDPYDDEHHYEEQSSSNFASLITKDYRGGIIEPGTRSNSVTVTEPESSVGDWRHEIIIERPVELDLPPAPPALDVSDATPHSELEHIRMLKRQQLEAAIKAKTSVNVIAPRSVASSTDFTHSNSPTREQALAELTRVRQQIDANLQEDPTVAYHARLAQLQQGQGSGLEEGVADDLYDGASILPSNPVIGNADNYARYDSADGDARWKLDSEVKNPQSPYILQTGFVIPATLISGINSELPGQIMAQVSQHVYDTPIGKWRLIPQGSRLVGTYSSEVEFGQARVLVAWQRIIFPDGKTMDIGAMPGADGMGYAGFKDQVNNHYLRIFGSALIMSAIVAGTAYSQHDAGGAFGRQNAGSIMSQSLGQQLGLVTTNLIRKNMNISPTLEIRPGYRFNLIVTKDMVFNQPYQSFDYARGNHQ